MLTRDFLFYPGNASSMPFDLAEVMQMVIALRDVCLGIIELAYPDAKPTVNDDYRQALKTVGVKAKQTNSRDIDRQTRQWEYLFKVHFQVCSEDLM